MKKQTLLVFLSCMALTLVGCDAKGLNSTSSNNNQVSNSVEVVKELTSDKGNQTVRQAAQTTLKTVAEALDDDFVGLSLDSYTTSNFIGSVDDHSLKLGGKASLLLQANLNKKDFESEEFRLPDSSFYLLYNIVGDLNYDGKPINLNAAHLFSLQNDFYYEYNKKLEDDALVVNSTKVDEKAFKQIKDKIQFVKDNIDINLDSLPKVSDSNNQKVLDFVSQLIMFLQGESTSNDFLNYINENIISINDKIINILAPFLDVIKLSCPLNYFKFIQTTKENETLLEVKYDYERWLADYYILLNKMIANSNSSILITIRSLCQYLLPISTGVNYSLTIAKEGYISSFKEESYLEGNIDLQAMTQDLIGTDLPSFIKFSNIAYKLNDTAGFDFKISKQKVTIDDVNQDLFN